MLTGNENKLFMYNFDRLIVTKKTLMIKILNVVVVVKDDDDDDDDDDE